MHIAIAGNIGSGKTTLTSMLAKHYNWKAHFEDADDNPFLNDFYEDMQRWSFNLQIYFLNSRFSQIIDIRKSGEKVIQQTRLWDTKLKQTYAMRTKEDAEDYRYFQDPDLAEVLIDEKWINDIKTTMPELPKNKKIRFFR